MLHRFCRVLMGAGSSLLLVSLLSAEPDSARVNGTTGTPLGGFGAGGLKFNANDGSFAAMTRPPADAYDFSHLDDAKFELFVQRDVGPGQTQTLVAQLKNGQPDDDAIWPLHRVNCGSIDGIAVHITAFSPFDRDDSRLMGLPCALYEITLTNNGTNKATAAVSLGLRIGNETVQAVNGQGFASKSWSVLAAAKSATISAGGDQPFAQTGACDNQPASGKANRTAVKLTLAPGASVQIHMVMAWYDTSDPERCQYMRQFPDAATVAKVGLEQFSVLKEKAETLVNRFRASNLPDWIKNQTLNTLANYTTNSMWKRDGRVAFAEGQWTCFGTMDQMWLARKIVDQLTPFFAWQELRFWARTQMKSGQIHHDFNQMNASDKAGCSVLVGWDDTEHSDYRNIQKWVDLNCAYIISVFEIYRATGDQKEFAFHWPHMKRAAQRILDQVQLYGDKQFPLTFDDSENSYDAGGDPNVYNAGLSAAAYKIMTILGREQNDAEVIKTYQQAYDTVVRSFAARYMVANELKMEKHAESYYGGQWLAFHLKLGEFWNKNQTDFIINKLNHYYNPAQNGLGYPKGSYDEWTPYMLTHYAGLMLQTRRPDLWEIMQKDDYHRQYDDRNRIFNHPLNILSTVATKVPVAKEIRSKKEYISIPGLWRNYYDIIGFHRDAVTGELWLEPVLPAELDHHLKNALYFSPEGDGTITCNESGAQDQNREIVFAPDRPLPVSSLYVTDCYEKEIAVQVNGKAAAFERIGSGYAKELRIALNTTIGTAGLHIMVSGNPDGLTPVAESSADKTSGHPAKKTPPARIVDGKSAIDAATANQLVGPVVARDPTSNASYVTSCKNFDYIEFARVDFGRSGLTQILARVASATNGSTVEIALDDVSAEPIGIIKVPNTSDDLRWADVSAPIVKTTGVHDVFLRFYGKGEDNLLNLNKIMFKKP